MRASMTSQKRINPLCLCELNGESVAWDCLNMAAKERRDVL